MASEFREGVGSWIAGILGVGFSCLFFLAGWLTFEFTGWNVFSVGFMGLGLLGGFGSLNTLRRRIVVNEYGLVVGKLLTPRKTIYWDDVVAWKRIVDWDDGERVEFLFGNGAKFSILATELRSDDWKGLYAELRLRIGDLEMD